MSITPSSKGLSGKSVVITGAAGGIGHALAVKFASAGANITVNDVDHAGANEVANEVGGTAVIADCASYEGVATLIAGATDAYGQVDVYIANAGVAGIGDVTASEEAWQLTFDVNLMAHVRAARQLVPVWLRQGGGRFIITASAAGLLSMPGAAPYAASKHAAVAFAEWLSMTYRDRGIVVQAICPQAVRTKMLGGMGSLTEIAERTNTLSPTQVADEAYDALLDDRFLILPHPEVHRYYMNRASDTDRWLKAMSSFAQGSSE